MSELVRLTWPELEHAWQVAITRTVRILREDRQRPAYGASGQVADGLAMHVASCPPELAVAKLLGLYWHGPEPYDPDAPDVGSDVEVRSTPLTQGCLLAHPADKDWRRYFLVITTSDPLAYRVAGWLWGEEAKQARYWRKDTGRPAYFVPQGELHQLGAAHA